MCHLGLLVPHKNLTAQARVITESRGDECSDPGDPSPWKGLAGV